MKHISIVIPAKDEEKRLPRFLRQVVDHCQRSVHSYEIIVVDDGSKDRTAAAALDFQAEFPSIKVISLERNHGKGYAVKQGFFAASGEIALFLDADGSTGPEEIERNLGYFDSGFDIVIGSRVLSDGKSQVKAKFYRRMMGAVFNFFVAKLLIKGIKDTQCGFKMFRTSFIRDLFGPLHLEGFGFDLEVLYLAQRMGLRVKEVAVNWAHVDGSKVDLFKDSLGMFWNIIQIRFIFKYNHHIKIQGDQSNSSKENKGLVSLSSMTLGQKAQIVAFTLDSKEGEHIQKLGLSPSDQLEIVRLPVQGGPVEVKIRGYFVSLNKEQADRIMVKPLF